MTDTPAGPAGLDVDAVRPRCRHFETLIADIAPAA